MTILQKQKQRHSGHEHAGKRRHKLGHGDQAVRHTDAWEHETFAEEQARWERADPEYARICQGVRHARERGEEASRRADQAKAAWDARVATQRQADDDRQKVLYALKADMAARRQTAISRVKALRDQGHLQGRPEDRAESEQPGAFAHRDDQPTLQILLSLADNANAQNRAQREDRGTDKGSSVNAEQAAPGSRRREEMKR
jgi:hypothetical protein